MTKLLAAPKTRLKVTTSFLIQDYVRQGLIDQYNEQAMALDKTLSMMKEEVADSPAYKALVSVQNIAKGTTPQGHHCFEIDHYAMVEGTFQNTAPGGPLGFIEASTLNLLLSTKLLTDVEKRAILVSRRLVPETVETPEVPAGPVGMAA